MSYQIERGNAIRVAFFNNLDTQSDEAISHYNLLGDSQQYIVSTFIGALTTIQNESLTNSQNNLI